MKTKKIYEKTINELNDKNKQKVIDKYRYVNVQYDDWYHWIIDNFVDKANKLGFKDIEYKHVSFNLDRGAYFGVANKAVDVWGGHKSADGSELWIRGNVENRHKNKKTGYYRSEFPRQEWSYGIPDLNNNFEILEANDDKLSRMRNKPVTSLSDEELVYISKKFDLGCNVVEFTEHKVYELCELCKDFFNRLVDERSYRTSDEGVAEFLEVNDFSFKVDDNGELIL